MGRFGLIIPPPKGPHRRRREIAPTGHCRTVRMPLRLTIAKAVGDIETRMDAEQTIAEIERLGRLVKCLKTRDGLTLAVAP